MGEASNDLQPSVRKPNIKFLFQSLDDTYANLFAVPSSTRFFIFGVSQTKNLNHQSEGSSINRPDIYPQNKIQHVYSPHSNLSSASVDDPRKTPSRKILAPLEGTPFTKKVPSQNSKQVSGPYYPCAYCIP